MDINELLSNLKKRKFIPYYAKTKAEGVNIIKSLIPNGASIGFGGSITVDELDLVNSMKSEYNLLHRSLYEKSYHNKLYKEMQDADWYITSTNALSMTGEFINIDGRANRVSAMLFGPQNILIVCGVNKIVNDIDEGISRSRNIAAPPNAVRLNKKTPCATTGKCEYCFSPDTMCRATVIQHHPTTGKRVYVVIINEILGY